MEGRVRAAAGLVEQVIWGLLWLLAMVTKAPVVKGTEAQTGDIESEVDQRKKQGCCCSMPAGGAS